MIIGIDITEKGMGDRYKSCPECGRLCEVYEEEIDKLRKGKSREEFLEELNKYLCCRCTTPPYTYPCRVCKP